MYQRGNHLFLGSGYQNESNSHQLARIGEKKIFHELDVHHVYKLLDSFWHPEPKNKWFLLCKHDVRPIQEKFSSRDSGELMAVRIILASWAQKQVIPTL